MTLALFAALAAAASGCGGGDTPAAAEQTYAAGDAAGLQKLVGNAVRVQLKQLAVITQAKDDASGLDENVPSGTLDSVTCSHDGALQSKGDQPWHCEARWTDTSGEKQTVAYDVTQTDKGCWYATANPPLKQVHDTTTRAPAESPLSMLVGKIKGC
ncbi:MAG: hypothetical protein ACRDKI_07455 [Solirubrobacterales bacterium]